FTFGPSSSAVSSCARKEARRSERRRMGSNGNGDGVQQGAEAEVHPPQGHEKARLRGRAAGRDVRANPGRPGDQFRLRTKGDGAGGGSSLPPPPPPLPPSPPFFSSSGLSGSSRGANIQAGRAFMGSP